MAVEPNVWRMRHGVICTGNTIPGFVWQLERMWRMRTCQDRPATPGPRSPRHRFFWIGELEVSAANLQGGGGRAVRLLSGLCVPFRLLLFCVVHASQCPVPFEGGTFEALQACLSSRDVGPIWDCPGHLGHASRRLHGLGQYRQSPSALRARPGRNGRSHATLHDGRRLLMGGSAPF